MKSDRACARGFSLIELMVVVVIVGILASVAYPSYTAYVQRSKISQATANLADYRIRMERYFQDNRSYASAGTTCGAPLPTNDSFTYACNAASATTYTATATGAAAGGMSGFTFDVDQNNLRRTTAFPGVSGTQNCWITKKGETC